MDFTYTKEQEAFRQEVLKFIAEEPPGSFPTQTENECYGFGCFSYEFTRRMGDMGWIGITFPEHYGGLGLSPIYQFILNEEMSYHHAPWAGHFFAYTAGQALLKYGTDEQKQYFLPRLARGEIQFWQGLSEPDAGSDLLNTKTKAVTHGDHYIIDGQKTWGSRAHRANHVWLMARTAPASERRGLSLFLIDMDTPGLSLRPIINLAGDDSFCELYLDSVKVPQENLLGGEGGAISVVLPGLEADRFWARSARIAYCRRTLDDLLVSIKGMKRNGQPLSEDAVIQKEIIDCAVDVEIARLLSYHTIYLIDAGRPLSYEGSVIKLVADELGRRIAVTARGILGRDCIMEDYLPFDGSYVNITREYIYSMGHAIAGGTAEIQLNTIATRGLGLPRK
ncbi:acyl-CoA dehydrogenase family protein [Chloroflexota bacterium]